jgi:hypothetical protein
MESGLELWRWGEQSWAATSTVRRIVTAMNGLEKGYIIASVHYTDWKYCGLSKASSVFGIGWHGMVVLLA